MAVRRQRRGKVDDEPGSGLALAVAGLFTIAVLAMIVWILVEHGM
ncbi:hypothetical protein [Conexibacter arvalis]|uniref:Uncharacterized protein n=1 Tax=Conexibacter arvalis TaxID=912552 RepID=A0A840I9K4_9ACTN|nr:hypothetical protein [Conexibacter arvalis]MBB4660610.1 hypothetical protein [Conexibacter arvalis]